MKNSDFRNTVKEILARRNIAIVKRTWEQALPLVSEAPMIAYWIRDSDDVINIVWLTATSIYDIGWFPAPDQSAFNYLPLRSVLSFEIRRTENVAKYYGFEVKGNLLVTAYCKSSGQNLLWVADTEEQVKNLENFSQSVFTAHHKSNIDKH